MPITPEALYLNVESGAIFSVGSGVIESLCLEWLQWGFEAYIVTDLCHDLSSEVSHLVVPDGWHATCVTVESVVHVKGWPHVHLLVRLGMAASCSAGIV